MKPIMQHDPTDGPVADHDYGRVIGAPFVVHLKNGAMTETNPITVKTVISITDPAGLMAAIVRSRVLHPQKLTGPDFKFIRTALGLKAKELAENLELTPEFYSRCEAGHKVMSGPTEKVFRAYTFLLSYKKDLRVIHAIREAKQAGNKKPLSPADAEKALSDLGTLFCGMKINPMIDVEKGPLRFTFIRGRAGEEKPCGDDDANWKTEAAPSRAAA